jgi:hypothetical protein
MRRLSDFDLHILGVVSKHERICIGLPVSSEWASVAADLRRLAKWKYLVEDGSGDDGPVYTLTVEGRTKVV